jgi:hypothetical protein
MVKVAFKNKRDRYAMCQMPDVGFPSGIGSVLYNEYKSRESVVEMVSKVNVEILDTIYDLKHEGWTYLFDYDQWFVKHGLVDPFVPLTDYLIPFDKDGKMSNTPFRIRYNLDHAPLLLDTFKIVPHNPTTSNNTETKMDIDALLAHVATLFTGFEADKTQVGCSIVIEDVPYVYTWNTEKKAFDKDEFPEI